MRINPVVVDALQFESKNQRRMMFRILFIVIVTLAFLSCTTDPIVNNTGFIYPLKEGNRWIYSRVVIITDTSGESPDTTENSTCTVEALDGEHVVIGVETMNLRVTLPHPDGDRVTDNWYANHSDGLFAYAYRNAGGAFVQPSPSYPEDKSGYYKNGVEISSLLGRLDLIAHHPELSGTDGNSITYEEPPLQAILYPLTPGIEWTYRPFRDPLLIDKRTEDPELCSVPAGIFQCHVIRFLYDFDEDGEYEDDIYVLDWIGDIGLVRRIIVIDDIQEWDEYGNVLRYSNSNEIYELQSFSSLSNQ